MIHQIATTPFPARKDGDSHHVTDLDTRLDLGRDAGKVDADIAPLYAQLKQLWEQNPHLSSNDIIDFLRNFVDGDGSMPYNSIPKQTAVLGSIMQKLKADGATDSPLYDVLNKSFAYAIASNGVLTNFFSKMMERPEDPEPW